MSKAGIAAVNCVTETYVVVRSAPFHRTTAPFTKLFPFAVSVNADPPAAAEDGDKLLRTGTGLPAVMVKVCVPDKPPPGAGLNTVTDAVPTAAISAAKIAAVNCVAETYVVTRSAPFHRTTAPFTKLLPFTVKVNALPPAAAEVGLRLVATGTGLLIVNVRAPDMPPPGVGLNTVTDAVPTAAISAAKIDAVNCVAETYVVARFEPFHLTTDPFTKLLPFTVNVNALPPAGDEVGLRLVATGTGLGLLIVKV
jgi:hypothetical protein